MHGETRGGSRRYYRRGVPRSYPQASPDHPTSVYVREDLLVAAVDLWIGELFAPDHRAATSQQLVDAAGIDSDRVERIANARRVAFAAPASPTILTIRGQRRAGTV